MRPTVEILSQGDEIIEGVVTDTNSAWLSQALVDLGYQVIRHTTIGDDLDGLVTAFQEIANRADLCISTGGLGPTMDDLTAEAIAKAFARPLRLDEQALEQIEAWFKRSGRPMPEVNRRQALLPEGASRIDNQWGTAPGFSLTAGQCQFICLPGVPREMKPMFENGLRERLRQGPQNKPDTRMIFHTIGVGESALQERLATLDLPEGGKLGFRAKGTENEVKVTLPAETSGEALRSLESEIRKLIGDALFEVSINGNGASGMVDWVASQLQRKGLKIMLHESLSQGALSVALSRFGVLSRAEIHPEAQTRLDIESDEVLERTLQSSADHFLRLKTVDAIIIQRWSPLEDRGNSAFPAVTLWTYAATEQASRFTQRQIHGTPERLQEAATLWGLDGLRHLLID